MKQPNMNPALLRLLVVFPNVLSYFLLFGLVVYLITNYAFLRDNGALTVWAGITLLLAGMAGYTTYSIVKRIRAKVL